MLLLVACAATDTLGPCELGDGWIRCPSSTFTAPSSDGGRNVVWSAPAGEGPFGLALLFQGSLLPPPAFFEAFEGEPFGGYEQVRLTAELLDAGYVVVAPATFGGGVTWWNTNVVPWADDWADSPDAGLVDTLLDELDAGTFGTIDPERVVAAGISSGGYMTSRMALTHADRFRRLVIESASYATCLGAACTVPDELPADHPPTLFLHGGADDIVPIETMWPYEEALAAQGTEVDAVVDEDAGHQWIDGAADEALAWLRAG